MNSSVYDFFDSYAQSLDAFDAKRATSHYKLPCMISADEGATVYSEPAKLEALFVHGFQFFKQNRIAYARPDVLSRRGWTDKLSKCRVRWSYFTSDNAPAYSCEYQYILRQVGDGWKIEMAVSVDEREKMEEWMASK